MRYTEYHAGKAVIKDRSLLAEAMEKLARLEDAEEKDRLGQWIPINERLPEEEEYILLSFANYTGLDIGRYEKDGENDNFYPGDDEKTIFKLRNICKCMDAVAGTVQGRVKIDAKTKSKSQRI